MKTLILLLFTAGIFSGCANVTNGPADDAILTQRIQHTWAATPDNFIVDSETTYLPEGVVNLFGHFRHAGKVYKVLGSGRWHIKGGYLHYSILHSNMASIIPNGFTSADRIVRITESEFVYIDSADGKVVTEHRLR